MKKMFISVIALAMSVMAMATEEAFVRIRFNGASGGESVVRLYQDDANTPEYESSFDSDKMLVQSNSKSVLIYGIVGTHKCEDVVTNNLQGVEIGFVTNNVDAANYKFTFENPRGLALQLYDRVEDKLLDMTNNATYTFNAAAGRAEINNRFVIGAPAIAIKGTGDWYNVGKDVDLVSTDGGLTATGSITFDADDLNVNYGYYNFNFVRGIKWLSNGSEFSREAASGVITGTNTDNMWFHLDVAGEYTFTWTYATNTLEIGFPAVAPVTGYNVTLNGAGLATFSAAETTKIPDGLKVYQAGNIANAELVLNQVEDDEYIPANTGVILYGDADQSYFMEIYNDNVAISEDYTSNSLKAYTAWESRTAEPVYILHGSELWQYTGTQFVDNKAFLQLPGGANNAPARISMRFNTTTAVENVETEAVQPVKFIENGEIFIRRGNEVYNLQGQLVK